MRNLRLAPVGALAGAPASRVDNNLGESAASFITGSV